MTYTNPSTGERYTGGSLTRRLPNGGVFSGTPSNEQLLAWGFQPTEPAPPSTGGPQPSADRLADIQARLAETDYIVLKKAEGRDISEYNDATLHPEYGGDFLAWRQALREEYNALEARAKESEE